MFRNLMIAVMLLGLTVQANATPKLYDITGARLNDGSTAIGTIIYDQDINLLVDFNLGSIYTSQPDFTTLPGLTIHPEDGVEIYVEIRPINDKIRFNDISDGIMPLYLFGSDKVVSKLDNSWLSPINAVRINSLACEGCTVEWRNTGLYEQEAYQQPVHNELIRVILPGAPVPVPEPSSLMHLSMASIIIVVGLMLIW